MTVSNPVYAPSSFIGILYFFIVGLACWEVSSLWAARKIVTYSFKKYGSGQTWFLDEDPIVYRPRIRDGIYRSFYVVSFVFGVEGYVLPKLGGLVGVDLILSPLSMLVAIILLFLSALIVHVAWIFDLCRVKCYQQDNGTIRYLKDVAYARHLAGPAKYGAVIALLGGLVGMDFQHSTIIVGEAMALYLFSFILTYSYLAFFLNRNVRLFNKNLIQTGAVKRNKAKITFEAN